MTIDRSKVEHGARLAAEATPGNWWVSHHPDNVEHFIEPEVGNIHEDHEADAAFIAHWNPEFAAELARDWLRLRRVERAMPTERDIRAFNLHTLRSKFLAVAAALVNQAAEEPERTGATYPVPEDHLREEVHAMIAEMRDPAAGRCTCGFPEQPCLRIMLRNGPPFPARPCEPVSANPAAAAGE